jgi:hypothetical protein
MNSERRQNHARYTPENARQPIEDFAARPGETLETAV